MNKIFSIEEIVLISKRLHKKKESIVVVGGCFDLLHDGHKLFLENAKKQGLVLVVLLESDKRVRVMKGNNRPFRKQKQRANDLAALPATDYIVMLPFLQKNDNYDELISQIKPAILATTKGDPGRYHKERQAMHCGARVVDVIVRIPDLSTTALSQNKQQIP